MYLLYLLTAPDGVDPPMITAASATSLQVTWTEPTTPNGRIITYSIFNATAAGTADVLLTNSSLPGSFIVAGLEPYTEYDFIVEACTIAGCTASGVGSGLTGESGKPFTCI